jgi:hypothetical protein
MLKSKSEMDIVKENFPKDGISKLLSVYFFYLPFYHFHEFIMLFRIVGFRKKNLPTLP